MLTVLCTTTGCAFLNRPGDEGANEVGKVGERSEASEASEGNEAADDTSPGIVGRVGLMVEGAQRDATKRFDAFMLGLDDFFAGDSMSEESNTSFLRVRTDVARTTTDSFEFDPSVKLRVVLPRSEQRFRLLFSTEEESGFVGDQIERGVTLDGERNQENVSLALRFVRGARNAAQLDFDIGLRQREGLLQVFGRMDARSEKALGLGWKLRASNRYYYFVRSGYDDRLRFDFSRQLGARKSRYLLASTTFDWRHGRKGTAIGQSLGIYADLGPRTALALEGLAAYQTQLDEGRRNRFRGTEIRLRFRRNVWRPWFFYELWPAVAWPAERDYRRTWNGLARIEVTIGGEYREFPVESTPPDTPDKTPEAPDRSAEPASDRAVRE